MDQTIVFKGQKTFIAEAIRNKQCTERALTTVGVFAHMCHPCKQTYHYLKNLLLKRTNAALQNRSRLFAQGMREDALTREELELKQQSIKETSKQMSKENQILKRKLKSVEEITKDMLASEESDDFQKFVLDCRTLFKPGNFHNSVQVEVIKNIVGKLKSGRNHHYTSTIKKIAALHKNFLGDRNYFVLKVWSSVIMAF